MALFDFAVCDNDGDPLRNTQRLTSVRVAESFLRDSHALFVFDEFEAILMIDEVDSFLQDRTKAVRSWEVTQVNELLTRLESFNGVFIATTNRLEHLDVASLRRFDLKLQFDYLDMPQIHELLRACGGEGG